MLTAMRRRNLTIAVGRLRTDCMALLDEVATAGTTIVVTRRGKAVARIVPIDDASLRGSVVRETDIVSPIDDRWGCDS